MCASWVEAVHATRPDAGAASAVVRAVSDAAPGVAVFVGGLGATAEHTLLGGSLSQASDELVRRLGW